MGTGLTKSLILCERVFTIILLHRPGCLAILRKAWASAGRAQAALTVLGTVPIDPLVSRSSGVTTTSFGRPEPPA